MAPPTIYGTGSGPANKHSIQVSNLARTTLQFGFAPIVGDGKTEWDNTHTDDLANLSQKFVEATQDPSKSDNTEIWGKHGYFFARADHHRWANVAEWITEEVNRQGYFTEPKTKSVPLEVTKTGLVSAESWGANTKGEAERARRYLDWEPRGPSLKSTIAEAVAEEAKSLGLKAENK